MKISVRAHEIATLLDHAPDSIAMLSLDCFDTLLWRNVHAPKDIFTEIAIAGGGVEPRARAQGGSQRLSFTHRSEEHTSELQSLMRISYAVFCLKKKKKRHKQHNKRQHRQT